MRRLTIEELREFLNQYDITPEKEMTPGDSISATLFEIIKTQQDMLVQAMDRIKGLES